MEDRIIPLYYLLEDCPTCWKKFIQHYTEADPHWDDKVSIEDDVESAESTTAEINKFLKEFSGIYDSGTRPKDDAIEGYQTGSLTFPSEKEKMLFLLKWS